MNIVQIGANRGNDDLSQLIGNKQPNILILIEPLSLHNETLKKHYNWVENLNIENIAISEVSDIDVDFFYHLDDGPGFEVSSLNPEHIYERHTHLNKNRISSIKIKTMNLNELFDKYNLKKIDILFIDAEGMDEFILKSLKFESYDIKNIFFENLHIKNYDVYDFIESKNYTIIKKMGTNGWCSLAKKNN
jgi:FkbM family methyltransferase